MHPKRLTKEHVIDLSLPEKERWEHVIRKEAKTAQALAREASAMCFFGMDLDRIPIAWPVKKMFDLMHAASGGRWRGELRAWADGTGVSSELLTLLNCQYELSHFGERISNTLEKIRTWFPRVRPFGCTAGITRTTRGRLVHVRNMDWPLRTMGRATRIFRFVNGDREFVTVGAPGMVGVLSGMLPGAYSASIDYAPPSFVPGFDFGPLFLLRDVLETCDTYDDACYALSHTKLAANVFFLICSADGRGCVIERTRTDHARRNLRGDVLTLANHHESRKFLHLNESWDPDLVEGSRERADRLARALRARSNRGSLEAASSALDVEPVFNDDTRQMMAFDPATGELLAWAR